MSGGWRGTNAQKSAELYRAALRGRDLTDIPGRFVRNCVRGKMPRSMPYLPHFAARRPGYMELSHPGEIAPGRDIHANQTPFCSLSWRLKVGDDQKVLVLAGT